MRIVGVLPRQSGVVAASDSDAGSMDPGLRASTSPTPSSRATSAGERETSGLETDDGREAVVSERSSEGGADLCDDLRVPQHQREVCVSVVPAEGSEHQTTGDAADGIHRSTCCPCSAQDAGRFPADLGAGSIAAQVEVPWTGAVARRRHRRDRARIELQRVGDPPRDLVPAQALRSGQLPRARSQIGVQRGDPPQALERCPRPWRVAGSRRGTTSWAGLGGLPGESARRHGLRGRARRRAAAERRRRLSVPAGPPSPLLPSSARSPMWGRAPHPRHTGDRRPRRPRRSRRAPHRHRRAKPLR